MTYQTLLEIARAWLGAEARETDLRARSFLPALAELRPRPVYEAVTLLYNRLAALLGLVVLSPLLLVLTALVKLTSRGPALYRGARLGRGTQPFDIYKFRTMYVGSEARIGQRLVQEGEDTYTPIGRFLRRYRLDELPQLINVLRGQMSLVGPRPSRPIFLEAHRAIPGYLKRFSVRPGITGLAQVRGGYYTHPRHKLYYDVLYILNRSVRMDLALITLTFFRVMTRMVTTGFLLAWLLLMALALPRRLQAEFLISVGTTQVNALYLVPTLVAAWHILRQNISENGRLYVLRTPVDRPLIAFVTVTLVAVPFSLFPTTALRGLLWYLCNGVVIFYLILNSRLVTDRRRNLIYALVGTTTAMTAISAFRTLRNAHTTGELVRLAGTVGDPILMAGLVVLALPLSIACYRQTRGRWRLVFLITSLVLLIGAGLTLSRSGILCLAFALALYFGHVRRRYAWVVLAAFGVLIGSLALAGDPRLHPRGFVRDLQAKIGIQVKLLGHLEADRALVGVGARSGPRFIYARELETNPSAGLHRTVFDNTYLTMLLDHGALGLLFFLAFVLRSLLTMRRAAARVVDPRVQDELWATIAGLLGFCVLLLVCDALYAFPMMLVFWSAMGLGVGTALMNQPGPRSFYRIVHFKHRL